MTLVLIFKLAVVFLYFSHYLLLNISTSFCISAMVIDQLFSS